jgi:hypothetical protein
VSFICKSNTNLIFKELKFFSATPMNPLLQPRQRNTRKSRLTSSTYSGICSFLTHGLDTET